MSDDLHDDGIDHNATMANDLLDAWHQGDDVFFPVLRRCVAEFDLAIVVQVLVSMNHALMRGHEDVTGISIEQYLAGLRADYTLTTTPTTQGDHP